MKKKPRSLTVKLCLIINSTYFKLDFSVYLQEFQKAHEEYISLTETSRLQWHLGKLAEAATLGFNSAKF